MYTLHHNIERHWQNYAFGFGYIFLRSSVINVQQCSVLISINYYIYLLVFNS